MQERADRILAMYEEAERRLLAMLKDKAGNRWSRLKMNELQENSAAFRRIVDRLTKLSVADVRRLLEQSFEGGAHAFIEEARALGLDIPDTMIPARLDRLFIIQDELDGQLNRLGGAVLRDINDKYRQIVGEGLQLSTFGVETQEQVMQRILNGFADSGIFAFVDRAGRHWGMGEYSSMATRTGMMNAAIAGYAAQAQWYGFDLVMITDHSDECRLCRGWENRVLSLTGTERNHPDCTGTLDEAKSAGLFHPNCLHSFNAYVPGRTIVGGGDRQSESRNEAGYNARQKQRYCERQLRRWYRRKEVALTEKEKKAAQARIDTLKDEIEGIVENYKTKRRWARERPYKAFDVRGKRFNV